MEFRLKAREKDALDGTTMILCLLWPEDVGRAQGKSRCRQDINPWHAPAQLWMLWWQHKNVQNQSETHGTIQI